MVGSTALSARLDPELLGGVIRPTRTPSPARSDVMAASSPNSWATACWPISAFPTHEDAPSGRLEPGSTSCPRSAALKPGGHALKARIGIATGIVVVGEIIGTDRRMNAVVGDTPNLAARLQALAEAGHHRGQRHDPEFSRRHIRVDAPEASSAERL